MAPSTAIAQREAVAITSTTLPTAPTPNNLNSNNQSSPTSAATSATPAQSRTRRDRPCDACRKRKSRCVLPEGATACALCAYHHQECTYVELPQPRKKRLNSGSLEGEIAKRRSPEADRPARVLKGLSASLVKTESAVEKGVAAHDASSLMKTLGLQKDRHSQYVGWTTEFEPCLVELLPLDEKDENSLFRGTLRKVGEYNNFLMREDAGTELFDQEATDRDAIQNLVGRHGPALVDLYFEIIHPPFPILHKDVFLQKYTRSYKEFAPCSLAAVYLLALRWWAHNPNLAHLPKPDTKELERLALKSLSDSVCRPKLSTVQAGLLLLQIPGRDSWVLTAQVVAMGQELALHADCSEWTIPSWERGLRRRLAWALYVQDKWSCLVHGRPSHIGKPDWAVKPLSDGDFPTSAIGDESGEENDGQILFRQMVSLTEILSDILDTFYSLQASREIDDEGRSGTRLILERAKPVQIRLKDWFTKLPAGLRMDCISNDRFSSIGFLHLAYFATEITLHRRIVRSLNPMSTDAYLVHICRSAAKTRLISAMDFVNRLKPEHLKSFWYFASKVNFALIGTFGSLLWATAPGKEEADFYKLRLNEYKWTLRVSSKDADFMDYAVANLDAATSLLKTIDKPPLANYIAQYSNGVAEGGQDLTMTDAPGFEFGAFQDVMEPFEVDPSVTASGLASPSTSTTSTGSVEGDYDAYPMTGVDH